MTRLMLVIDDKEPQEIMVTSPTTLVTKSGRILGIATPSGAIIEPAESTTGKIAEVWDEFNRPVVAEITWDGAKPSQFGRSMGLLRSED